MYMNLYADSHSNVLRCFNWAHLASHQSLGLQPQQEHTEPHLSATKEPPTQLKPAGQHQEPSSEGACQPTHPLTAARWDSMDPYSVLWDHSVYGVLV